MKELIEFQKAIGVSFKDASLLKQALIHSSYVNENPDLSLVSNERLEFLGDAVLGLIVAEKLYRDFLDLSEGTMTRYRSAIVRRETLAKVARNIGLGNELYLGRGEEASGGREKPLNLAGAMEAVIGAIFLDRGLVAARKFILILLNKELRKVIEQDVGADYKSKLQELVQLRQRLTPHYRVVEVAGPEHHRTFTVEVMVGKTVEGRGSGASKKQAETEAARIALQRLYRDFTE